MQIMSPQLLSIRPPNPLPSLLLRIPLLFRHRLIPSCSCLLTAPTLIRRLDPCTGRLLPLAHEILLVSMMVRTLLLSYHQPLAPILLHIPMPAATPLNRLLNLPPEAIRPILIHRLNHK